MMPRRLSAMVIVASFTLACSMASAEDEWPQFRGPGGEGHGQSTDLPLTWSETENVTWKVPIEGRGWSSPVVSGIQVWMTTAIVARATPEESKEKLDSLGMSVPSGEVYSRATLKAVCVDLKTGKLLRDITLFEHEKPLQICAANSLASPTPVIEKGRLYCDFGTMGTACVDTATGEVVWRRTLPIEHQVGPGSSPILYKNMLILVRDGCYVQYIAALDKTTGETLWKTDRPEIQTSVPSIKKAFSTPLIFDSAGGKQMVIPAAQWICSYDPDSGKPLWSVDTGHTYSNTTRPVFGHGLVYVTTAYGGSMLLAIRVDGQGDVTGSHIAWESRKLVPRMPSPLLVGDQLYTISDNGAATCYDAKIGEIHYTARISSACWASPMLAAGRIHFFNDDGTTTIIRPGKEFEKLAENKLDGRIMATPAVVDGALLLRTDTHLYRIEK